MTVVVSVGKTLSEVRLAVQPRRRAKGDIVKPSGAGGRDVPIALAEELVPRLDDVAPHGEIASRRREAPEGAFREAGLAEGDSQLFRAVNV